MKNLLSQSYWLGLCELGKVLYNKKRNANQTKKVILAYPRVGVAEIGLEPMTSRL